MSTPSSPSSFSTLFLALPPSCIVTFDDPKLANYVVIGTYYLEEDAFDDSGALAAPQSRRGELVLCYVDEEKQITVLQELEAEGAVTDIRHDPLNIIYAVTTAGHVITAIVEFPISDISSGKHPPESTTSQETPPVRPVLVVVASTPIYEQPTFITSLKINYPFICLTTASSTVSVFEISHKAGDINTPNGARAKDGSLKPIYTFDNVHEGLEVWTSVLSRTPLVSSTVPNTAMGAGAEKLEIMTGGDDGAVSWESILRASDLPGQDVADAAAAVLEGNDDKDLHENSPSDEELWTRTPGPVRRRKPGAGEGITALHLLPLARSDCENGPFLLAGSYDGHLRVLKTALSGNTGTTLADLDLSGGVWSLDRLLCSDPPSSPLSTSSPSDLPTTATTTTTTNADLQRIRILASCMHAGAAIVEVLCWHSRDPSSSSLPPTILSDEDLRIQTPTTPRFELRVLARFTEHQSMCYAAAFLPDGETVVSTSFYDRRVCVWRGLSGG